MVSAEEEDQPSTLEWGRRWLTWACVSIFVGSFAGLLALSATTLWTPGNPWIGVLDLAWRASLVIGVVLWAIPRAARGIHWLGATFSG